MVILRKSGMVSKIISENTGLLFVNYSFALQLFMII